MEAAHLISVPRVRGDEPPPQLAAYQVGRVFPACAGMNRRYAEPVRGGGGVPRVRGDEPGRARLAHAHHLRVPRVRGDEPALEDTYSLFGFVFPACAGMNRSRPVSRSNRNRVPRVRGDEPPARYGVLVKVQCSPRARG